MRRRSRRAVAWLLTLALFIGMLPSGLLSTLVQAFNWQSATLTIDPLTGEYTVNAHITAGNAGTWALAVVPNVGADGLAEGAPSRQMDDAFAGIASQSNMQHAVTSLSIPEGTYIVTGGASHDISDMLLEI